MLGSVPSVNTPHFLIGTRGSPLALAQTHAVVGLLTRAHPHVRFTLERIRTQGDRVLDQALPAIGGKGLFTAEIEQALLSGRVHLAVHSLKDLPTAVPAGLCIAGVPPREDPRDVLVSRSGKSLANLPHGTRVGTSSLRRQAQLLAARPDLEVFDIRGNVDTRLAKLRDGQADAIVLAAAGLARLGRLDVATEHLDIDLMVPAAGQGALAVQAARNSDAAELAASITDPDTAVCVAAERALLSTIGAGCHAPVGSHATMDGQNNVHLTGLICSTDGSRSVKHAMVDDRSDPERLGRRLADYLLNNAGRDILAAVQ